MVAPLILVVFACVAADLGRTFLSNAPWVQRSPRWGIWAWQALTVAITSALLLAGTSLAVPVLPVTVGMAWLVESTPFEILEHYSTPAGAGLALVAAVATAAMITRLVALFTGNIVRSAHGRRDQIAALNLVGLDHPDGYIVLDHPAPMVYCLPGRQRVVVVTRAAAELLSPTELRLVLAHERTHLRARHDLALALSDALARTFFFSRLFRRAHEQITMLVEMQADDAAQARGDRRAMARALVALGGGGSPVAALGAADTAALRRVRRLTTATVSPLPRRQGFLVGLTTAALLAAPLALALAPALEAATRECCVRALPATAEVWCCTRATPGHALRAHPSSS